METDIMIFVYNLFLMITCTNKSSYENPIGFPRGGDSLAVAYMQQCPSLSCNVLKEWKILSKSWITNHGTELFILSTNGASN